MYPNFSLRDKETGRVIRSLREEVGAYPKEDTNVAPTVRLSEPDSAPLRKGTMAERLAPTLNPGPEQVEIAPSMDLNAAFSHDTEEDMLRRMAVAQEELGERADVQRQVQREDEVVAGIRGTFHENPFASRVKKGKPMLLE